MNEKVKDALTWGFMSFAIANIVTIIELYTPFLLLLLTVYANYRDLGIIIINNLILETIVIIVFCLCRKKVAVNICNLVFANLVTWVGFSIYMKLICGQTMIEDLPFPEWISQLYSFNEKMLSQSPHIIYSTLLLWLEYAICLFLPLKLFRKEVHQQFLFVACILTILLMIFYV